jgi:hypothetical protein
VSDLPESLDQRIEDEIPEAPVNPTEIASAARSCQAILLIGLALALIVCLLIGVMVGF